MDYLFTFPISPTLNEQLNFAKGDRFYKSAAVKIKWSKLIADKAGEQYREQVEDKSQLKPMTNVLLVFTWFYHYGNIDPDGLIASAKFLMDGLVDGKVLMGDSLKYIMSPVIHHFVRADSKVEKRVELKITPVDQVQPALPSAKKDSRLEAGYQRLATALGK